VVGGYEGTSSVERAFLLDPLLAAAVQQPHIRMAVILVDPEGEGREPVPEIPVKHHGGVVGDPGAAVEGLEGLLAQDVPPHWIVQILPPVEEHSARDVAQMIGAGRVIIHLHDPHLRILKVLGHPLGVHQSLRIRIRRHGRSLLKLSFWNQASWENNFSIPLPPKGIRFPCKGKITFARVVS
jgi:hypothetical protein